MKVYCLFEQSGTFKNEFRKLGYDAEDYDIQNLFGQTDHVVDLFQEIQSAYSGGGSLFDQITHEDLVLAFFPCERFDSSFQMNVAGNAKQLQGWTDLQRLEHSYKLHGKINENYCRITEMAIVAFRRNIRMVIENPVTQPHYLTLYWPLKPALIDKNRRDSGDYYKKPTQYWFLNMQPYQNLVFEPQTINKKKDIEHTSKYGYERSLISPEYARRFILEHLIPEREA